ncbi:MAG: type II toxin-antitoxin system Phd/YefM family antitoxin [Desulfobaccales bacterium]
MAAKWRSRREAGIIFKGGEATAVIQDIEVYQDMLEGLEDAEDLITLMEIRQKPFSFRRLDDFLEAMNCSPIIN